MKREGEWIGLMVNGSYHCGEKGAVEREIGSVFGRDLLELRVVCSDEMATSTGEYYAFVRVNRYQDHLERLRRSAAVVSVVPSFDGPYRFSGAEVEGFAGSAKARKEPREFHRGDMVLVTSGYMKNLYGVVVRRSSGAGYEVAFRFHLRRFSEILPVTSMRFVANVIDRCDGHAQCPRGGSGVAVQRHKLRRKKGGVNRRRAKHRP